MPNKRSHVAETILSVFLLFVVWVPSSYGQATYGTIVGTTRDSSGAVVPGVTVTVTNVRTGETFTSTTNDVGAYAFNALFPDSYTIHAQIPWFRPVDVRNILLQVNQTARFDLTLQLGEVTESVEVIATAPVLSTDTSDVGQVINNKQIVDLPLNGRNFMQLAALTNGVILSGSTESGGPNFLSHGGRPTQNSFLVEGVETRIQREGRYGLNLSVDAIGEFKVMQNAFSAEYGRAATIVNATIKTGGNEFHGSVFEFLRNDKLDSRNAFDLTGTKPPLRLNQFGASVGGPIRRDKTFFFFNWESQRVSRGSTRFTTVPTPARLQGDLADMTTAIDPTTGEPFPNNRIPLERILPYGQAAAGLYPNPTGSPLARTNFTAVLNDPVEMDQFTGRIDHTLSDSDRINGHITFF